ncbi:MAG: hypothetical protein AMJ62_06095 [Myxococcales bacterium SG8_38]|nr:MAG: hypothetical protein AMJ62_06095 [Myxococcales bacterium SG8_38]
MERMVEAWTGAILKGALLDSEKEALSIELYDASFRRENDHDGLYAWETQWFARRLPSPPASILIGAAGSGREAAALRKLGYQVHAFEPSTPAFRIGQRVLGSELIDQASYHDLVEAVLLQKGTRLRLGREARFDAVLLGWGSFGHVLRRADRLELLRACDRIAPEGPILLSIFEPGTSSAANELCYTSWGGFLARPTAEELAEHAQALNRKLVVSLQSPTSYATFVPNV